MFKPTTKVVTYSLKQNQASGLWHILKHTINNKGQVLKTKKAFKNLPKSTAEDYLFKLERNHKIIR